MQSQAHVIPKDVVKEYSSYLGTVWIDDAVDAPFVLSSLLINLIMTAIR
jgi:hypothetical protein